LVIDRLLTSIAQLQRVRLFISLCVVSVTSGRLGIVCVSLLAGTNLKKVKRIHFSQ